MDNEVKKDKVTGRRPETVDCVVLFVSDISGDGKRVKDDSVKLFN